MAYPDPKAVSIHGTDGTPTTAWDAQATVVEVTIHETLDQTQVLAPDSGVQDGQIVHLYASEAGAVIHGVNGGTYELGAGITPLVRISGWWIG